MIVSQDMHHVSIESQNMYTGGDYASITIAAVSLNLLYFYIILFFRYHLCHCMLPKQIFHNHFPLYCSYFYVPQHTLCLLGSMLLYSVHSYWHLRYQCMLCQRAADVNAHVYKMPACNMLPYTLACVKLASDMN